MSANPDRPEAPESAADEADKGAGQSPEQAETAADELVELQAKADENWDRYLRAAAEIENVAQARCA